MSNFKEETICFRNDGEHSLEIRVYEDNEKPDYYHIQVQPVEWYHKPNLINFGIDFDEPLTIEEVNKWLDNFWLNRYSWLNRYCWLNRYFTRQFQKEKKWQLSSMMEISKTKVSKH